MNATAKRQRKSGMSWLPQRDWKWGRPDDWCWGKPEIEVTWHCEGVRAGKVCPTMVEAAFGIMAVTVARVPTPAYLHRASYRVECFCKGVENHVLYTHSRREAFARAREWLLG